MKILENKKGITLIALVVTIVVLIVLAGVSISTTIGNSGLINKAKNAKTETEIAKKEEEKTLNKVDKFITEESQDELPFIMLITFGEDGIFQVPINEKCEIDWGDGKIEKFEDTENLDDYYGNGHKHVYENKNKEYEVKVNGKINQIEAYCMNDKSKILEIKQWGVLGLKEMHLRNCNNLRKIASPNLRSFENVENFYGAFMDSNIESIPEDLFENCSKATVFDDAFANCLKIKEIPENLFINCRNATSFSYSFCGCTAIQNIPEKLFQNCKNVESFWSTFEDCTNLKSIPLKLFDNCKKVTSYATTFADCINIEGELPKLWSLGNNVENNFKGSPNGEGCFYNCSKAIGFLDIPKYWVEYPRPS